MRFQNMIKFLFQKKKKVRPNSVVEECGVVNVQWSNADIEFPSTSTSDEIEIISQPDDETICKLLTALPLPSETHTISTVNNDELERSTTDLKSSSESQPNLQDKVLGKIFIYLLYSMNAQINCAAKQHVSTQRSK